MTSRCYSVGTKLFPLCTKIWGDEDPKFGQPAHKAEQAEQQPIEDRKQFDEQRNKPKDLEKQEEAGTLDDAMQSKSREKDSLCQGLSKSNELRAEDMSAFRDQCAAGVLQAIEMIQVLEHQLWSERAQRQRAETDVKVLLSAVHVERNVAADAVLDMNAKLQEEEAAQIQAKQRSQIPVDELPSASSAATSIQKHFRGHVARKEFQERLIRVLQGIDPTLVPSQQSSLAQPQCLQQQQQQHSQQQQQQQQQHTVLQPPPLSLEALRTEVENIEHRAQGQQGQQHQKEGHGQQGEGSLASTDAALSLDVGRILKGPLPAGAVGCIAALVRRCKDLQAALTKVSEELAEARRAEQGLRQQNAAVMELSQMRIALEQERALNKQLRHALAQLQHAVQSQRQAGRSPQSAVGLPIHGATADIEQWEDLRASAPTASFLLPTAQRQHTPVPPD